jgi:hypothetical protein
MKKLRLYFNEFNLLMGSGGVVYLPLVSGILSAYIKTSKLVRDNVEVQPFIFRPDTHQQILSSYSNPDIACFSIAMWNEQLSLKVAKGIKEQFPLKDYLWWCAVPARPYSVYAGASIY